MKNVFKTYPNGVGAIYDLDLNIEKGAVALKILYTIYCFKK